MGVRSELSIVYFLFTRDYELLFSHPIVRQTKFAGLRIMENVHAYSHYRSSIEFGRLALVQPLLSVP